MARKPEDERGPSLRLVVNNARRAARSLTLDEVMALAATDKRHAFAVAEAAIYRGDRGFIHEILAEAVTHREVMADLMAMHAGRDGREAQILRLATAGHPAQREE